MKQNLQIIGVAALVLLVTVFVFVMEFGPRIAIMRGAAC